MTLINCLRWPGLKNCCTGAQLSYYTVAQLLTMNIYIIYIYINVFCSFNADITI